VVLGRNLHAGPLAARIEVGLVSLAVAITMYNTNVRQNLAKSNPAVSNTEILQERIIMSIGPE